MFCLSQSPVYKTRTERRFIRCSHKNKIIKIACQKLGTSAFNVPAQKGIFTWLKRKHLPFRIIQRVNFNINNITRGNRIIKLLNRFKNLTFYSAAACYLIIALNGKEIIRTGYNKSFHKLLSPQKPEHQSRRTSC